MKSNSLEHEIRNKRSGSAAVVAASFGTAKPAAIKACIEPVENAVAKAAGDMPVFRAFTSDRIIELLKKRHDITVPSLAQTIEKLVSQGYAKIYIQPTFLLDGEEYEKLLAVCENMRKDAEVFAGEPLLYHEEDARNLALEMKQWLQEVREDEGILFVGHQNKGHDNNDWKNGFYYEEWDKYAESDKRSQRDMTVLMRHSIRQHFIRSEFVTNEQPMAEIVETARRLENEGTKKLRIVPVMLAAGYHVMKDLAGAQDNSWKNVLAAQGFDVSVFMHGLGECEGVCRMYEKKARQLFEHEKQ